MLARFIALTIPAVAVQRSQAGVYAFALGADGQTVRNQVLSVVQIEDGVAIVAPGLGLTATDKVVTDGTYQLQAGSHVTLAKPGSAASGAARGSSASGEKK